MPDSVYLTVPLGALDAQTKEQMQQFLLELWEQTQTTILMITHDVEEAILLSCRVYVMSSRPGQINEEMTIPLPTHRHVDLKLTSEFLNIKRQVMHSLRDA